VPGQRYQLEVFGNRAANGSEAERLLGSTEAVTDARGEGHFTLALPATTDIATLTATATSALGATSPLSAPLSLR